MNWKIALVLLVPFVSLVVAIGACGGNDCTNAEDKLTSCVSNTSTTSTSSSGGMTMIACSGSFQCKAECINRFTCDQINGNFPAYTTCIMACQGR
jgi:hypothetical protein